ncbi:hypothetical protein HYX03_00520 [Candidatus Woesearchaeota archaeon]|nr:hypothetical protein [Candidatus Woesearchaeota archaeon]
MGLEEDLKAFIVPYKRFLRGIGHFINPFIIGERAESVDSREELAQKRMQFLTLFEQLPVPTGSSAVRTISGNKIYDASSFIWHQVGYFCGDLIVLELDYEPFKLVFSYRNRKVSLGEQGMFLLQRTPIPGSTLKNEAHIYFKKPVDLDWEIIEVESSMLLRSSIEQYVCRYKSAHGVAETNYLNTWNGRFSSERALKEGRHPIIGIKIGGKSEKGMYSAIREVSFDLRKLGYGELNAFMKHVRL